MASEMASEMKQESARFSQQAINRIAELAIASQLKQDVEIQVDIATTLKQLTKGQIDAIAILIERLILAGNLQTELFRLDLGTVTVKPLSAMKGKIKLVHPSEGKLTVLIHEDDLTTALNQTLPFLRCILANDVLTVQFYSAQLSADLSAGTESIVLEAILPAPQETDRRVVWQPLFDSSRDSDSFASDLYKAAPSEATQLRREWVADCIVCLDQLLGLKDFEQKGLFLSIQNVQIADGKLRLDANALIQEFPPD